MALERNPHPYYDRLATVPRRVSASAWRVADSLSLRSFLDLELKVVERTFAPLSATNSSTPDYPTGQPVTAEQMESLSLKRDKFHGDWNYSLSSLWQESRIQPGPGAIQPVH